MSGTECYGVEFCEDRQPPLKQVEIIALLVLSRSLSQICMHLPLGFFFRRPACSPAGHELFEPVTGLLCWANQASCGKATSKEADVVTAEQDSRWAMEERHGTSRMLPQENAIETLHRPVSGKIRQERGAQGLGQEIKVRWMDPLDRFGEERATSDVVTVSMGREDGPRVPRMVAKFGQRASQELGVVRLPSIDESQSVLLDDDVAIVV